MKTLTNIINESNSRGEWCLWDYTENGVHEILIWKGNGKDQSDVTEIDKDGIEMMNVEFDKILKYCEAHKKDKIDKWHLDFFNAKWEQINKIF